MTDLHTAEITITANGTENTLSVRHHWSLLDVLRDVLGLTGAKRGCDRGECGSCHRAAGRDAGQRLPGAGDACR